MITAKEGKVKGHRATRETPGRGLGSSVGAENNARSRAGTGMCPASWRSQRGDRTLRGEQSCLPSMGSMFMCLCIFCSQEGQALIHRPRVAFDASLPSWTAFPRRNTNSPAWRRWWRSNSVVRTFSTEQEDPTLPASPNPLDHVTLIFRKPDPGVYHREGDIFTKKLFGNCCARSDEKAFRLWACILGTASGLDQRFYFLFGWFCNIFTFIMVILLCHVQKKFIPV